MTNPGLNGHAAAARPVHRLISGAALLVMLMLVVVMAPARAAAPSAADQQCLTCHGMPGLQRKLGDGETLSLQIDASHFADSVHAPLGCTGCHSTIKLTSHLSTVMPIESRQAFSLAMSKQVCGTCHAKELDRWQHSVHAALVSTGNAAAPVCTNCHSPHSMTQGQSNSVATVPCKNCHAPIFNAYLTSVHGTLRAQGMTAAPLCFNCHGAHDVAVPSAGVGRRDVCLGCHREATESHRTWLPNVDLHFAVVSCPVCHTPQAHRVVDLVLYNSQTQKETPQPEGIPEFENLSVATSAQKPGLDPATLMTLLGALNNRNVGGKTAIRGRLEVSTGIEDHLLTVAAKAIGNCAVCHRRGAAAFQSVEVSVAGPAGIPINYSASSAVLTSVFSIPSIGGFYAIGATRVTLLDIAFALALLVGVGWSGAHLIARVALRNYTRGNHDAQRKG